MWYVSKDRTTGVPNTSRACVCGQPEPVYRHSVEELSELFSEAEQLRENSKNPGERRRAKALYEDEYGFLCCEECAEMKIAENAEKEEEGKTQKECDEKEWL